MSTRSVNVVAMNWLLQGGAPRRGILEALGMDPKAPVIEVEARSGKRAVLVTNKGEVILLVEE